MRPLKGIALVCLSALAFGASAQTIVLTQISDFSGRGKGTSKPTSRGAQACISAYNATAGKAARARLEILDDQFDPARTAALAEKAVAAGTSAFINSLGAGTSEALATVADRAQIPVVGAMTGATSIRSQRRPSLFFLRSGITQEGRHAVRQLVTLSLRDIAVFHTADAYGQDGLAAVTAAMQEAGLPAPRSASFDPAKPDVASPAQALAGASAVVMFATGPTLIDFVKRIKANGSGAMLIAASTANMSALVDGVGPASRGIGYLRTVPAPTERSRLGREFTELWRRHGDKEAPTPFHLEGCLAAQLALRAAGGVVSPAPALMKRLKTGGLQNFGEFKVNFDSPSNEGSSWVGIAVVDQAGRLVD
ncbi:MAG: ABC transporter substrate-binding protein [Rhizobacter sp.]|nr:ABC transporter substrate-binding protein [Rhizobacter sp.]